MAVQTRIHPHEATGFRISGNKTAGYYVWTPNGDATLTLDPLPSTTRWELRVELWGGANTATGTDSTYIVFQHQIWPCVGQLNTLGGHTFTIDPSSPLRLEFYGFPTSSVGVNIYIRTVGDAPTDSHRVAVLSYTPSPSYNSAVLGVAVLGSFRLPSASARTDWTIVGTSYLGASFLVDEPEYYEWATVTDLATSIQIARGFDADGLTRKASVGSATITFDNALDPRATFTTRGTPIIVMDTYTRLRLFTGVVDSLETKPVTDGGYITTLTCVDKVADIAASTVYQRTNNLPSTYPSAFAGLLTGHRYRLDGATQTRPLIGKMVKQSSLADWLDIYSATAGLAWLIDRNGIITLQAVKPAPSYAVSIQSDTPTSKPLIDPVGVTAQLNTSQILSTVTITNNTASYDAERGEWVGETADITATNSTIREQYGEHNASMETAGDPSAIETYYSSIISGYRPWQSITSASFIGYDWARGITNEPMLTALCRLDVGDTIETTYRNADIRQSSVTRISHDITPLTWHTEIELD
ncbi:MAG: hypothetical protein PUK40_02150 [Actinomycetaceae bacterium]|nr:hypothetical protein [Actinomycetaceae bacterium]MDY6142734.1 hypothetical protein [Arcanobacterium sp.]